MSLPERAIDEVRHWKRLQRFPAISILSLSYFDYWLQRLLMKIDIGKVSMLTLSNDVVRNQLNSRMQEILRVQPIQVPSRFSARKLLDVRQRCERSRTRVGSGDARRIVSCRHQVRCDLLRANPGVNTSLFRASALYGGGSGLAIG